MLACFLTPGLKQMGKLIRTCKEWKAFFDSDEVWKRVTFAAYMPLP